VSQSNNPRAPDGGTHAYSASGLPPGLNINASAGAISGTITVRPEGGGPHRIVPGASDLTFRASLPCLWQDSDPTASAAPDNDVRPDVIIDPPEAKNGKPPQPPGKRDR